MNELDLYKHVSLYSRTPGPKLKDWHVVGHDLERDAKFAFPPNWCMGDLVYVPALNKTECQTPAGIAAITYDVNPLVCIGSFEDTMTIKMSIFN